MNNKSYLSKLKDQLFNEQRGVFHECINLAFGESYQYSNTIYDSIIAQLPEIYQNTKARSQKTIGNEFENNFWELAGQQKAMGAETTLACYSASIAIKITSDYLKTNGYRIALIEPTFDNLPSILERTGVETISIGENVIFPSVDIKLLTNLDIDAIFIVLPNNPTGRSISKSGFNDLVNFCAKNNIILIVDFCLRFFSELIEWDQYEKAFNSDCNFIFIEDTGKTWPIQGIKTALLTTNNKIFHQIHRIYSDILLNVSPFALDLLGHFICNTKEFGIESTVFTTIQENRAYLRKNLDPTLLIPFNPDSLIGYEWLNIISEKNDIQIWNNLKDKGIYVLPGSLFYWKTPQMGEKYLRIALLKDSDSFKAGIDKLINAINL